MTELAALWLPILLSSVAVFLVSSIIHMLLPWHKNDYPKIPKENELRDALRPFSLEPGDYMLPRPDGSKDYGSPEFLEKVKQGPNLIMTVLPNEQVSMGKSLGLWFLYSLIISVFAAYVASIGLSFGSTSNVFRVVFAVAFAGYNLGLWQMSIWYKRGWILTFRATIDGIAYAAATAGVFLWLWP